jgi:hypothetical protein
MEKDSNYEKVIYDSTIALIEREAVHIVSWDELFGIEEFTDLYEHSSFYLYDAINFLGKEGYTNTQKLICINSMQRLNLEDYLKLCVECSNLYNSNKISEDILKWAIIPNFSNRYNIVRNYKNISVVKLLNGIRAHPGLSQAFKKSIDLILSGESWDNIKEVTGN